MPALAAQLFSACAHDGRMRQAVVAACGIALAVATGAETAAEGASLRGLRAPGLIDFAPLDASRAGLSNWQPGAVDAGQPAQPSVLYGLREVVPANGAAPAGTRLSYSYSDTLTGVVEAGQALQTPYTSSYALSGQVVQSLGRGLGIGLGLRQRQAGSNLLAVAVQQGWGSFRGGYTLYSGRGDSTASPSHRFALSFDYSTRSSIGLSYTAGRDLLPGMLPFTPGAESRDWALTGFHWLSPQWALTYDVVNSEQAAAHRQGLRFGIRHTF